MIDKLLQYLPNFPRPANQTRCFTHTINLIAKSLLQQFDIPKKKAAITNNMIEQLILTLAAEIEFDEADTKMNTDGPDGDDNVDGWVDEIAALTRAERAELNESVQPVRLVLVKVGVVTTHLATDVLKPADLKTVLQNHQLIYPLTSRMVPGCQGPQT